MVADTGPLYFQVCGWSTGLKIQVVTFATFALLSCVFHTFVFHLIQMCDYCMSIAVFLETLCDCKALCESSALVVLALCFCSHDCFKCFQQLLVLSRTFSAFDNFRMDKNVFCTQCVSWRQVQASTYKMPVGTWHGSHTPRMLERGCR